MLKIRKKRFNNEFSIFLHNTNEKIGSIFASPFNMAIDDIYGVLPSGTFVSSAEKYYFIYIYGFVIYEEYQNKGYGTESLQRMGFYWRRKRFAGLCLRVFKSNLPAIRVYDKCGFVIHEDLSMYDPVYFMVKEF